MTPAELCEAGMHHQSEAVILWVSVPYVLFAAQWVYYTPWHRADYRLALPIGLLLLVFVFCMLSGYLTSLLPLGEVRWFLREWLHWFLGALAWSMCAFKFAERLAEMVTIK